MVIQDIRADEAQRDWGDARAAEIRRLRNSVAETEQHLAALIEHLKDLEDLEDITVEEQLQQADLIRQCERTRYVLVELRLATCP
jgi:hypothetical protein